MLIVKSQSVSTLLMLIRSISFNILPIDCSISFVCNISWYDISSQSNLNNILETNIKDDTVVFDYYDF